MMKWVINKRNTVYYKYFIISFLNLSLRYEFLVNKQNYILSEKYVFNTRF